MSWASVVKTRSESTIKRLVVKDNISCGFMTKTVKHDNIPRQREISPHPRDDFIMTNGDKIKDNGNDYDMKKDMIINELEDFTQQQIPENHCILSLSPLKMIHHNQTVTLINGYTHTIQLLLTSNIPIEINIIIFNFCFIKTDNLKHWFVCCEGFPKHRFITYFCEKNPLHQAIVFCSLEDEAIELSLRICNVNHASCILDTDINEKNDIDPITSYNNGEIQYIVCHDNSPIHLLKHIDANKLKIILMHSLVESSNREYCLESKYLNRATIGKYMHRNMKIHVISFIDKDSDNTYLNVEKQCKVLLTELPSNLADALVDEK